MSDSDSDNEFKDLLDAFDQVTEEGHENSEACQANLEIHGKVVDPYAPRSTIKEDDRKIIDSLKNESLKRKRNHNDDVSSSPAKISKSIKGTVYFRAGF